MINNNNINSQFNANMQAQRMKKREFSIIHIHKSYGKWAIKGNFKRRKGSLMINSMTPLLQGGLKRLSFGAFNNHNDGEFFIYQYFESSTNITLKGNQNWYTKQYMLMKERE